jgi:hypothetical protein
MGFNDSNGSYSSNGPNDSKCLQDSNGPKTPTIQPRIVKNRTNYLKEVRSEGLEMNIVN